MEVKGFIDGGGIIATLRFGVNKTMVWSFPDPFLSVFVADPFASVGGGGELGQSDTVILGHLESRFSGLISYRVSNAVPQQYYPMLICTYLVQN